MRRLPGPASRPLGEGVKTPEAPVGLFRGWQRTQTQSSVRTLRSLRQQMDVWFCLMQESSAERHCCVTADPDQIKCAPSGARPGILCFSLDFDYIDVAFSQTDFVEDLKKITIPVLVMHSEDDQIVPYVAAGPKSAKLLKNGTLITYKDFPHGMPTTQAERINADLLAFLKS